MNIHKDLIVAADHNHPFLLDVYFLNGSKPKPVVVFAHGFKGFKDWGHWDLIARNFAKAGFVFVKFNFSHNGTTLERPSDFANLEAFGQNNYSKEMADLDAVIDWIEDQTIIPASAIDLQAIHLIGHSRGGGIGIIKAIEDRRIKRLITWAAVSSLSYAWTDPAKVKTWQETGVYHQLNGRTKQQMPLYYQLYEDFLQQKERFDIQQRIRNLNKPMLIIHGTDDPAVPFMAAQQLQKWNKGSQLHLIESANHVFGGAHPYASATLPAHSRELVERSIAFLKAEII